MVPYAHPAGPAIFSSRQLLVVIWTSDNNATLIGELDLMAVPMMRTVWDRCQPHLELDCSGVGFVDPSGLGALSLTHKMCQARGGGLVLLNPSYCLLRLMSLTNSHLAGQVRRVPRLDLG